MAFDRVSIKKVIRRNLTDLSEAELNSVARKGGSRQLERILNRKYRYSRARAARTVLHIKDELYNSGLDGDPGTGDDEW